MRSVRFTEPPTCPQCKAQLLGATSLNSDRVPAEGDTIVCGKCGTICAFENQEGKIALRMMYSLEIQELSEEVQNSLRKRQLAIRARHDPFELSLTRTCRENWGLN
jgi:transcription elongation factor Elf1